MTGCDTWPLVGTWGAREQLVGGARGGSDPSRVGKLPKEGWGGGLGGGQGWCWRDSAASRTKCPDAILGGRVLLPVT